jgi:hypothetical protein
MDINNIFDVVVLIGPNDMSLATQQLEYTKKNIIGYRNIYLLCYDSTFHIEGCISISENIFPFSIDTIYKYHGKTRKNSWYLQQLLKLYAGLVIPDILDKYLIIDCDTFFLKPTVFYENGLCLYNYGNEFHIPYFIHMKNLHPSLKKVDISKSGICHHMLFETKYVKEIIDLIEKTHNDVFYNVFLKCVTEYSGSGASEYEIYFNYMLSIHPDKIKVRGLKWKNTNNLIQELTNDWDYVSYHWYLR